MRRVKILRSGCGQFGASAATSSRLPAFPQVPHRLGADLPAATFNYETLRFNEEIRKRILARGVYELKSGEAMDSFAGFVRLARGVLETCEGNIPHASDRFAACLLQNCSRNSIEDTTPVQKRCWPLLLRGHSIRVTAPTGSGKTLAYLLPTLLNVLATPLVERGKNIAAPNALILVPSSELAFQVQAQALRYGQPPSLLRPAVLCGGVGHDSQHRILAGDSPPRVIIATIGRIFDMLEAGCLTLDNVAHVIIDEDDAMLNSREADTLIRLLDRTPANRQLSFWSATRSSPSPLLDSFLQESRCLDVDMTRGSCFPDSLTHEIVWREISGRDTWGNVTEFEPLFQWLRTVTEPGPCLIFARSRTQADRLTTQLQAFGARAAALHAGGNASARNKILRNFTSGDLDILCCTDLLQRGIDLRVRYVINLSPPGNKEVYIHRAGRSARAGRIGHCVTFLPTDRPLDFELDTFLTSEGVQIKQSMT